MELFIFDLQKETCLHCLLNKGRIQGDGWIGLLATPLFEIIKGNKTITEAIWSQTVPMWLIFLNMVVTSKHLCN